MEDLSQSRIGDTALDGFLREMDCQLAGWDDPQAKLHQALADNELALYWQPIAAVVGNERYPMAEVLVRLHEEEASLLPPGQFLPLFEHYRMMPELDRWVIRNALRHLARDSRIARLAVNVSSQSVNSAAFAAAIAQELAATGVSGSALVLEIDESTLLSGGESLRRFAAAVGGLGCAISIDGFGLRARSFAPLAGSWVKYVKVEGAIVRKLLKSEIAELQLRAIVHVGKVMGYAVIAEMVEEPELLSRLASLGVPLAQGFGVRKPQPIGELAG